MIELHCIAGQKAGQVFTFEKDVIVFGRDLNCAIVLEDDHCSRSHARILWGMGGLVVQDLGSKNGIRLNNRVVIESAIVEGDVLTLGRSSFKLVSAKQVTADPGEGIEVQQTIALSTLTANSKGSDFPSVSEIQRANGMMRAAYKLSQAINTTLESEVLHRVVTGSILEHFKEAEHVCILLRSQPEAPLEIVRNVSRRDVQAPPVSQSLLRRAEAEWVGILASDAAADSRFDQTQCFLQHGIRSLMLAPMVARGMFIGAICVQNCSKPACFSAMDLELLTLLGTEVALSIENARLFEALQRSLYETVRSLSNALEAKDKYTYGHSQRVASYSVGIARELGLSQLELDQVQRAAELHDVGKIAIPEAIITKAGKLSSEEFERIKQHPQLGVDILKPIQFLAPILPFILHHHERFSGGGYPANLKGEEIPLEARIIGLADAFDAMTTLRSYNQPRSIAEGLAECQKWAGTSFDPRCVRALESFLQKTGPEAIAASLRQHSRELVEA